MKFILIGDGRVAQYHRRSIEHVGGEIITVIDPKNGDQFPRNHFHAWKREFENTDYFVICSPSQHHRSQIKFILQTMDSMCWKQQQIICEKPAFLPWEIPILDDRINIVLQIIYEPLLALIKNASKVSVKFVRDEKYFKTWKGDPRKTGGIFYNLFIHWIYLSHLLECDFEGIVVNEGEQYRYIYEDKIKEPILNLIYDDMQKLYNKLYEEILNGNGIKPEHLFYLNWILQRNSEFWGYGKNGIGKLIKIDKELL